MTAPGDRLVWLDMCKGLAIILVVVGHVLLQSAAPAANDVATIIYLFHMPLFFLCAGVTLRAEKLRDFVPRKTLALLIPYLFFLALLGVPALVASCGFNLPIPDLGIDRCTVMPIKLLLGGSLLGGMFGAFWFIPCLFAALILAQMFLPVFTNRNALHQLAALAILATLGQALPQLLPSSTGILALGTVPTATALVLLGYAFCQMLPRPDPFMVLVSSIVTAFALVLMVPLDMKFGDYGIPLFSLAAAVALCYLLIQLTRLLERSPVATLSLQALGQRTLTIFYLHQTVHLGLRHVGLRHDLVLILLSLAIPIIVHRPITRLLAEVVALLQQQLSRKSPSL